MKSTQILIMIFLSIGIKSFGQCNECPNNPNYITHNGAGTFTSISNAQAYYWEICEGNATVISSDNTDQTFSIDISCPTNVKVKLTLFNDGLCEEICYSYTCGIQIPENCTIEVIKPVCNSTNYLISRGYYKLICDNVNTNADWLIVENSNQDNFNMGIHQNIHYFKPYLLNYNFYDPITIKAYVPNTNI